MPVRGIGIDVVKVERLVEALERFGERFEKRIFTDAELAYCRRHKDPLPHLAARFAAKEAALKAFGTGLRGRLRFTQIEVSNDESGRPMLVFRGEAERLFRSMGVFRTHVSLTHERQYAVAVVIFEE